MNRLNITVHVQKDDGTHAIFGPDDNVPAWAVAKISNPNVWDESPTIEDEATPVVEGVPAKGGPGATRQLWADYAGSKGFAVQEDWKRDDIIAALEAAGLA